MYKLMIVDNDRRARERIHSGLCLEKLGITLCAEADNGIQAVELFMRHRPQIVVTELNLPLVSGMEAVRQILQTEENTKVIVITGSATVEQVGEAVRMGVADLLPKPVACAKLEAALRRTVSQFQNWQRQLHQQQRFRELLERNLPGVRAEFFRQLLRTPQEQVDTAACVRSLQDFGIPVQNKEICVCILVPDYSGIPAQKQEKIRQSLTEELEAALQPLGIGTVVLQDAMQRTVAVCYAEQKLLAQTLTQKLSLLRDKMRYLYRQDFYAAVGQAVDSFAALSESRIDAEQALCYWDVLNDNHIVSGQDLQTVKLPPICAGTVRYEDVMAMLTGYDPEQLGAELETQLQQAANGNHNSIHNAQVTAIEMLAMLVCCARELGAELQPQNPAVYVQIMQQSSVHGIKTILRETAKSVSESLWGRREDSKFRALADAKRYISQHYADPTLSLAKVAEQVNLSTSYMSQLFKKMENTTFTEYLNHVRIEQAKRLLSTTHMRVYEVADAVGYQSSKYFFQLFKQITGKRPREFYQSVGTQGDKPCK